MRELPDYQSNFAGWLFKRPHEWSVWAWRAALSQPVMTLMRGRPWEDCC